MAVHEQKDSQGRLLRRVVFQPDGRLETRAFVYQGATVVSADEEELDASRKPIRRLRESFDKEGRISEREDTSARNGRMVGTRTRYSYDEQGRRSEQVTPIE